VPGALTPWSCIRRPAGPAPCPMPPTVTSLIATPCWLLSVPQPWTGSQGGCKSRSRQCLSIAMRSRRASPGSPRWVLPAPDFATQETGHFETAFAVLRHFKYADGDTADGHGPTPFQLLGSVLDELVTAGVPPSERRPDAAYWHRDRAQPWQRGHQPVGTGLTGRVSAFLSISRPRCSRDVTVPTGMPRISATSRYR
jgi:hypothetical protein